MSASTTRPTGPARHWLDLLPEAGPGEFDPVIDPILDDFRIAARHGCDADLTDFLTGLERGIGRAPDLRRPGSPGRSDDEDWIAALIRARRRDDAASYRFLLLSRMDAWAASDVHFRLGRALLAARAMR